MNLSNPQSFLRSVKRSLKSAQHSYVLARCVAKLRPDVEPSDRLLQRLIWAWNNEDWSGDVAYLHAVCREAMLTQGQVLECGSGLTTLLLAVYAGKRGVPVVSLEHTPEWRNLVCAALERFGLKSQVVFAPLKHYDGFDWYEVPQEAPSNVQLVICDGPPGKTLGGRYGLFPVCHSFMDPGCTILLDDAERPEEQEMMRSWAAKHPLAVQQNKFESRRYVTLRLGSP